MTDINIVLYTTGDELQSRCEELDPSIHMVAAEKDTSHRTIMNVTGTMKRQCVYVFASCVCWLKRP